jgi:two-component system cell cycle response regulator
MSATILVVDDLENNIKLLEAKLASEYYNVLTANSAEKAFEVLENNRVDLILLDVMMPNMDGIVACRKIKENPETSYIPVVMVTAMADIEDRIRGLEAWS